MPGRPVVLVVEDDASVAKALGRELRGWFEMIHVRTAAEALDVLEREEVVVAICDAELQRGPGGVAILEEARRRWPHVGRLMLSGCIPEQLGPLILSGVIQRFIAKPWVPAEVQAAVHDVLNGGAALHA